MSKRRRQMAKSKPRSGLEKHKRHRKTLLPPLAQLPVSPVSWVKDLLPEVLWLDSVIASYDLRTSANILHATLDIVDTTVSADPSHVVTGLVSSFGLVPAEARSDLKKMLVTAGYFDYAFSREFLSMISNYPSCPMHWLVEDVEISSHESNQGIEYAKEAVLRLFPSRATHASRCRMIPLARLAKHGKLVVTEQASEIVELLADYSEEMDEERQKQAESVARAMFLSVQGMVSSQSTWPADFWRRNYSISPCDTEYHEIASSTSTPFSKRWFIDIVTASANSLSDRIMAMRMARHRRESLATLAKALSDLMDAFKAASTKAALDTYELDRDDVLFGLVSRQFHLYYLIANDTRLWIPEYGLLFHRVMADTLIIGSWLAKRNDAELFRRFKTYSLGKQKLYKLHLEQLRLRSGFDTEELEEMLSERISEEIMEEFLPIELGAAFEGTTIREMAIEANLKEVYDLVYAPTSSEVHGEWSSLKEYSLGVCANPLHRLHRLPRLLPEHVSSPGIPLTASSILADTVLMWLGSYGLAEPYSRAVDQFRAETNAVFLVKADKQDSDQQEA